MSDIHFQKWQGAGNDFVIIDNRDGKFSHPGAKMIRRLCDRHFGIGADGLMLIGPSGDYDFEMIYYNSDGNTAEMCGNGGRCIAAMAARSGIFDRKTTFVTTDGIHEAEVIGEELVRLRMTSVNGIRIVTYPSFTTHDNENGYFLNTGVPHLVIFVKDIDSVDVETFGRKLRYLEQFSPAGTNVNFVEIDGQTLHVRTYERGVEGETLACGTGNVAAAIAAEWTTGQGLSEYDCITRGGNLKVSFRRQDSGLFTEIWLEGPAVKVFEGK
jgi:diaminopimelate epimerase